MTMTKRDLAYHVFRTLFALVFLGGGVNHFANPGFYQPMMPPYVPAPDLMIVLSGIAEIVLGAALLVPKTTRPAAWGLIALLVAVFPANLHMALHQADLFPTFSPVALWIRLPIQGLLIAWAYAYTRPRRAA